MLPQRQGRAEILYLRANNIMVFKSKEINNNSICNTKYISIPFHSFEADCLVFSFRSFIVILK